MISYQIRVIYSNAIEKRFYFRYYFIMEKKRLITSALPYVNNIPHLGNLLQVLSADVFARYCRERGYETLYICGTDEYGTATETRALAEGVTPRELCDRFHGIHTEIYKWFNIDFDYFGRTSTEKQTEIVQSIFNAVDEAGYITERTTQQLFCISCDRFLADRYVLGTCPHCDYGDARGDQCEACGKLLDPTELIEPRCGSCSSKPELKETRHLYIDLPKALPLLEHWMKKASVHGFWANNAIAMTKSWIRDGLKERCITRDLKWGIPVPKEGFENKVFYVWFDAPIGYISITASYSDDWEKWWKNPREVELFQFIGKDNIPFHTVIFPSSLLATGEEWTMLHHMSSTEYLNYENGKFSKSKGTGVFGNDAIDTKIPADVWRFYLFYNRPEKTDVLFTWKDFQEKINGELIGNFGNLVNRTLSFVNRFYEGKVPEGELDGELRAKIDAQIDKIDQSFNRANLKDAIHGVMQLSDLGNKAFQAGEPWKMVKEDPQRAAKLLRTLIYLIRDLAILIRPFTPTTAEKIATFCGNTKLDWNCIGKENFDTLNPPEILFAQLEDDRIAELRARYAGSQDEREKGEVIEVVNKSDTDTHDSLALQFNSHVSLKVGKIIEIEVHPDAEHLYVEKVEMGNGIVKQIVSGLVKYHSKEELLGKNVVVVDNLKSSKFRGILSEGMLLAAETQLTEGVENEVKVLMAEGNPGDILHLKGFSPKKKHPIIKVNRFFEIPILLEGHQVKVDGIDLFCGDSPVTSPLKDGTVG